MSSTRYIINRMSRSSVHKNINMYNAINYEYEYSLFGCNLCNTTLQCNYDQKPYYYQYTENNIWTENQSNKTQARHLKIKLDQTKK
jgi:hypothetical protein